MRRARDAFAVAVVLLGAASASCSHSPSAADCPQAFDVLAWCVAAGTCDIDGVVIKACLHEPAYPPETNCESGAIEPGASLTINIESLWPLLGTRDDLLIYEAGGPDTRGGPHVPAFNTQRLFYDDTPVDVGIADARQPADRGGPSIALSPSWSTIGRANRAFACPRFTKRRRAATPDSSCGS